MRQLSKPGTQYDRQLTFENLYLNPTSKNATKLNLSTITDIKQTHKMPKTIEKMVGKGKGKSSLAAKDEVRMN